MRGFETLEFEEAIEAEQARTDGAVEVVGSCGSHYSHRHHTYLARGIYSRQIMKLHEYFDSSQLLVIFSEDLFANTDAVLGQVWSHIGVRPAEVETSVVHKSNPGEKIPGALRERLDEYFAPYNRELSALLDRDLPSGWAR